LVPTSSGAHVPIAQVAKIRHVLGPQELKSENGLLVGYVTMNTRERDEVSVVEDAERLLREEKRKSDELVAAGRAGEATLVVPPGYHWKWGGQYENQQRAMATLSWLVPAVLFAMFVMIYLGLGRWWLAFVVFACILVSACGGLVMVAWWGANMSVAVWVGFIALFGVADDCAVVILSFLEDAFKGKTPLTAEEVRETVIEATLTRVRPLLMTTATTVIGLLPLFLTQGRGSDVMQPMALPSIGGMAVQLLAFLLAPCVYCMVMEWGLGGTQDGQQDGQPAAPGPAPAEAAPEPPREG
jgi:Cu(I)/Ag(I) efflux system membrane protein CusA/SilA